MSLPLDFQSASGQELCLLSTPDSRGLGSRAVLRNEVPTPPVPPRDELLPVTSSPPQQSPPSVECPFRVDRPGRCYLPPAMTDLKLAMDYFSVPMTSFRYFVAPELSSSPGLFPIFMDLPPEIHRIIFRFCDTPTLFHLIHTSSYTRQACLDLFWQFRDDNTWYRLEKPFEAFAEEHPKLYHCPEFASRVRQVEITLPFGWFDRRREFWGRFQDIFPSAQRVVFYGPCIDRSGRHATISEPPGGVKDAPNAIPELVGQAPLNITTLVATPSGDMESNLRYQLWRIQSSELSLVNDPWRPMRVILPPRRDIRPGILNHFLTSERLGTEALREMYGSDWLKWETYLRYPNAKGIECPNADCNDKFLKEADWKRHLSGHDEPYLRNELNQSMLTYCRNTPADVKAVLDEKQRRIDEAYFIRSTMVEDLIQWYQENGDRGRRQFEETLVQQLKEYGFLTDAEPLNRWGLFFEFVSEWLNDWGDEPVEHEDYEVDTDQEDPEEEISDCVYAGEEYFVYPE
ncbi:hypothetical protein PEBR_05012 [Penicillium brasilianum]|uniref:C2H2-type domain-containing protein n=1 Tax=Penicillium brasilianum TaxID=104259 RepID=A0A1S9RXN1_PENBI|nr:hypothetical protein PEBR_05012 [Penicillium brasilianum]